MAPSMTWGIAAISVSDQIEKYGAYAGLAAIVGLAVLSLLYFAQAREVKRLREWAGRAPERAAELEARVAADASRRTTVGAAPQTAAAQAATGNVSPASPVAAPGTPGAAKPAEAKPAVPAPVPGLPVPVPAAGAPAAAPANAAASGIAETAKPEDGEATPAPATPAGTNGVTGTPAGAPGPRVPGRPPPTSTPPVPPTVAAPSGPVADPDPDPESDPEPAPATRALRGGPPSRSLPTRDGTEPGRTPSRRTLGVLGGAALVVAAVVVVLILTLGGNDTPPAPNQVADTVARTTASEPGRTQSTRQARIDRADTPVIVLNATGVNGLARQVADRLQSTGYQAAVDNSTSRPQTLIGYKSGADAAAKEIGKLLDVPSSQIQPMPQDLVAQAGSNAVIVVIGADKASD
jgi:hypothetical protein